MTWHLKDRELEKKLIAIDPKFVRGLQKAVKYHKDETTVEVGFGGGLGGLSRFTAEFRWDELEEIPEYNPHAWNEYPKITPPSRVMMQIEYDRDFGIGNMKVRVIGIYSELRKCWFMFDPNSDEGLTHLGCPIRRIGIYENLRFRPWEE